MYLSASMALIGEYIHIIYICVIDEYVLVVLVKPY